MKLEEYTTYYNCFHCFDEPRFMVFDGKKYDIRKEEFWSMYDLEIDEWIIDRLNIHDSWGFTKILKNLETEKEIINFLEERISDYFDTGETTQMDWLLHTLDWFLTNSGNFKGWQVVIIEKWLVTKKDIYSKVEIVKREREETLEDMFKDPDKLQQITEKLEKNSFTKEGIWKGKHDHKTGKIPKEKQLAALALVITEKKLLKKDYNDKETAIAFLQYFNMNTSGHYFKFGQRIEIDEYKKLFAFF